jgi:hypothetical protein
MVSFYTNRILESFQDTFTLSDISRMSSENKSLKQISKSMLLALLEFVELKFAVENVLSDVRQGM